VPMIAVRRFEPNKRTRRQGQDRFLMPREVYPVTAILRAVPAAAGEGPPAGSLEYRLELRDPLAAGVVELAGRAHPLASDVTTPLAFHLARSPLPILQEIGLLDPGWVEGLQGLYMLQPYRPGKIPIVFVHGLRSTPLAWLKVINEVWGDPALREHYQVWLYMYPTGKPLPSTATRLREDLDELRGVIDPGHADPMLDRMILIGHSMGGLISKMMILESGDAIWRLFSNRPFEELQAPPDRREALRKALFFSPDPSVGRIIFIATPHRGSQMGDELIGRITDRLIRLPRTLRTSYRSLMASNDPEFFTPMLRDGIPTSIAELRLDNPFLTTLARLPRRADVPVHSIIGRKDPSLPLEQSSDGVVPYLSAHIDWAQSECVVEGDHMCQDVPETIREIRRILVLHLEETSRNLRR
jgi:pimeloyl-ACP methyl ester carboxylesterase